MKSSTAMRLSDLPRRHHQTPNTKGQTLDAAVAARNAYLSAYLVGKQPYASFNIHRREPTESLGRTQWVGPVDYFNYKEYQAWIVERCRYTSRPQKLSKRHMAAKRHRLAECIVQNQSKCPDGLPFPCQMLITDAQLLKHLELHSLLQIHFTEEVHFRGCSNEIALESTIGGIQEHSNEIVVESTIGRIQEHGQLPSPIERSYFDCPSLLDSDERYSSPDISPDAAISSADDFLPEVPYTVHEREIATPSTLVSRPSFFSWEPGKETLILSHETKARFQHQRRISFTDFAKKLLRVSL